jgi:hypothetical protein
MLMTCEQALATARSRQRRGLRDVARLCEALGEPVRFLRHDAPRGVEFEAIGLNSARTCAHVAADGAVTYPARARRFERQARM